MTDLTFKHDSKQLGTKRGVGFETGQPSSHRVHKDNRLGTAQLKELQQGEANADAPAQLKGDMVYWYRTAAGQWQKAGKFKSHAPANAWLKINKQRLGIVDFGQGGKNSYQ